MENDNSKDYSSEKDEVVLNQLIGLVELSLHIVEQDIDPFLEYVNHLRARFQSKNSLAFRARFIKGFQTLLKETPRE